MGKLNLVLFVTLMVSCRPPVQEQQKSGHDEVAQQFIRANQYMQQRHQDHIAAFVERVGWNAEVTPSGLWIVLKKPGEGDSILDGSRVSYRFESLLLNGTPCYESPESEPKVITIGKGGIESGVEEGLQMLRKGAEAILLIPPHLGHGNFGDRDRIPGNSVLIYRLKVLEVEN